MGSTGDDDAPRADAIREEKPEGYFDSHFVTETAEDAGKEQHHLPKPSTARDGDQLPPQEDSRTTIATRTLQFVSSATPTTLAAVGVGFAAATYTIFGQLGLLLIGAFVGVVGFIAIEARHPEVSRAVRGEQSLDILERLGLELAKTKEGTDGDDEDRDAFKTFDDFRPETRDALGGLVDAVIRDYVKWWYSPIIPTDRSFPLACRKTLNAYLFAISSHLYRKRPADVFLDLLTNSSSMIIVFMSELASAFSSLPPDSNPTAVDTVYSYLASNPDSNLANLLNNNQQSAKFKMVSEDLLQFLEKSSYSSGPARVFLREIFANSILEVLLQTCSKADWINGWIVYLLEEGEPDLSQAIDVGMQTGPDTNHHAFADIDGNLGNVNMARPSRNVADSDRGRRKESMAHKKKLSKADEEMEEAMEEMKRMNAMIAQEDARRHRDSLPRESMDRSKYSMETSSSDVERQKKVMTPGEESPRSGHSFDKSSPPGASNDGVSTKSDMPPTPITPASPIDPSSPASSLTKVDSSHFTNFDQIVPKATGIEEEPPKKMPLSLHNASFTLHDDNTLDNGRIRSKPTWDYLIQVEPSSAAYPGWMIVRRYSDFETLHEILRRIATISGATAFTELHKELPNWKIHTRESLRGELERYLRDACWYQSLAESEGMRRFLEKSQGHTHTNSKSFGWEIVGKNMLDVLTTAPKGAMEGGKNLVGGVSGVFGNFSGLNRKATSQSVDLTPSSSRLSISTPPRVDSMRSPARSERTSLDSQRSSVISTQPGKVAPMERRPSYQAQFDNEGDGRPGRLERMDSSMSISASARQSREHSRAPSIAAAPSPTSVSLDKLKLPPHPDEISDDFEWNASRSNSRSRLKENGLGVHPMSTRATSPGNVNGAKPNTKPAKVYSQLSEQEARVAVELLFAVINEMYTLSSAWNIRRTLLTAAKSFLLRPGNPSLLTVQSLIQSSVLDANSSDEGIAFQLRKLRENTMPTDAERATWPAELSAEEKEKLRVKARRLLIQSGVPAALMGVMGQAATGEALGRVFDCLQIEEVARGLIFGLILQLVRVVTH